MRKRITSFTSSKTILTDEQWLDLEQIAQVEITSENPEYQIEEALLLKGQLGWRAAQIGEQVLRIIFDQPQQLKKIRLCFIENQEERTQEFVLRWSADKGKTFQEIVRQQWNFNSNSIEEIEDYSVELANVTTLELVILPGKGYASLQRLRLA